MNAQVDVALYLQSRLIAGARDSRTRRIRYWFEWRWAEDQEKSWNGVNSWLLKSEAVMWWMQCLYKHVIAEAFGLDNGEAQKMIIQRCIDWM